MLLSTLFFFFSSRRRHTRLQGDWSSDVCSSDLTTMQIDAGIHSGIDLHGGEAGFRFALSNRPMDWRGAAIFREQRSVQVDPAVPADGQVPRRYDLAVGDDYDHVGPQPSDQLVGSVRGNFFGLMDRQSGLKRELFDRRWRDLLPAAARPVGLCDDGHNLKVRLAQELPEGGNSELRSAAENDAHGAPAFGAHHSPFLISFLILRLMRSRLSMLRCWRKRMP